MPIIWGQQQGYLYLQLRDFKRGDAQERHHAAARADARARRHDGAGANISRRSRGPICSQPPAPPDVAERALRANVSVGCTGCHLDQYQGDGTQPRLAGQNQGISPADDAGFPHPRARQQSRHVRPDAGDLGGRHRGAAREYLAGLQIPAPGSSGADRRLTSRRELFAHALVRPRGRRARLPLLSAMVAVGAARRAADSTIAPWPSSAAIISAVRPRLSTASIGAPASSSSSTTSLRRERAHAVLVAGRPHQRRQIVAVGALGVDAGRRAAGARSSAKPRAAA